MNKIKLILSAIFAVFIFASCTKTESDFSDTPAAPVESIKLTSPENFIQVGTTLQFRVFSSLNNVNVTSLSKVFVNGSVVTGDSYKFETAGTYAVYATKDALTTNVLSIQVNPITTTTTGFVNNALVEEYSGTWCGNCPRILYGVDLLHQQTNKAIVVGIHLFNGDPFITAQGNSLAASLGVSGVPTGRINRTMNWTGPQYENVQEVTNAIQPIVYTGIGISSSNTSGNVAATIKLSYKQPVSTNTKLTVYLVEDNLYFTQRNYSSNLYGGQANVPNFRYDGVLRSVLSDLSGDAVANSGSLVTKSYNFSLPANITNANEVRIVAFVTDGSGKVLNAQTAKLGEAKDFENL